MEFTGRGTHTGTFVDLDGRDPTHRKVGDPRSCATCYELRTARSRHSTRYLDTGSMMAQLGLTSAQTATATQ